MQPPRCCCFVCSDGSIRLCKCNLFGDRCCWVVLKANSKVSSSSEANFDRNHHHYHHYTSIRIDGIPWVYESLWILAWLDDEWLRYGKNLIRRRRAASGPPTTNHWLFVPVVVFNKQLGRHCWCCCFFSSSSSSFLSLSPFLIVLDLFFTKDSGKVWCRWDPLLGLHRCSCFAASTSATCSSAFFRSSSIWSIIVVVVIVACCSLLVVSHLMMSDVLLCCVQCTVAVPYCWFVLFISYCVYSLADPLAFAFTFIVGILSPNYCYPSSLDTCKSFRAQAPDPKPSFWHPSEPSLTETGLNNP